MSQTMLPQYVAGHPGQVIVPVDQVFRIGQMLWEREPYQSMAGELAIFQSQGNMSSFMHHLDLPDFKMQFSVHRDAVQLVALGSPT